MEKLKTRVLGILAIFVVLFGMTGVVGADPCPAANSANWNDNLPNTTTIVVVSNSIGTNKFDYKVQETPAFPPSQTPPIGFQELCIKPPSNGASVSSLTIASGLSWKQDTSGIGFKRVHGTADNIPFDGNIHDVGTMTWNKDPGTQQFLVHINDPVECNAGNKETDGTCFRAPGKPTNITPELGTLTLTASGLFGLVLATRKYKNR
jgi:hypothetical protein